MSGGPNLGGRTDRRVCIQGFGGPEGIRTRDDLNAVHVLRRMAKGLRVLLLAEFGCQILRVEAKFAKLDLVVSKMDLIRQPGFGLTGKLLLASALELFNDLLLVYQCILLRLSTVSLLTKRTASKLHLTRIINSILERGSPLAGTGVDAMDRVPAASAS